MCVAMTVCVHVSESVMRQRRKGDQIQNCKCVCVCVCVCVSNSLEKLYENLLLINKTTADKTPAQLH